MRTLDGSQAVLLMHMVRSTEFTVPRLKFSPADIEGLFVENNRNMLYEVSIDSGKRVAGAGLALANLRDCLNRLESDCVQLEGDTSKVKEEIDLAGHVIREFRPLELQRDILVDEIESCRAGIGSRVAAQDLEMQRLEEEVQKENLVLGTVSESCTQVNGLLEAASETNRRLKCKLQSLEASVESLKDRTAFPNSFYRPQENNSKTAGDGLRQTLEHKISVLSHKSIQFDKMTGETGDIIEGMGGENGKVLYAVKLEIHKHCSGMIEELGKMRELEERIVRVRSSLRARECHLMALFIAVSMVFYAVYIWAYIM